MEENENTPPSQEQGMEQERDVLELLLLTWMDYAGLLMADLAELSSRVEGKGWEPLSNPTGAELQDRIEHLCRMLPSDNPCRVDNYTEGRWPL